MYQNVFSTLTTVAVVFVVSTVVVIIIIITIITTVIVYLAAIFIVNVVGISVVYRLVLGRLLLVANLFRVTCTAQTKPSGFEPSVCTVVMRRLLGHRTAHPLRCCG